MDTKYPELNNEVAADLRTLHGANPDAVNAFYQFAKAGGAPNVLDKKTKELIALAIAVAGRCEGCIAGHVDLGIQAGATREEVADSLGVAMYMGGGPSVMYSTIALKAYDQISAAREKAEAA